MNRFKFALKETAPNCFFIKDPKQESMEILWNDLGTIQILRNQNSGWV